MTDRELLELAAKAAGIVGSYDDKLKVLWFDAPHKELGRHITWNPLTDDGDALRLAVKLKMETYHADDDGYAAYAAWPNARGYAYAIEQHGSDPYAATRRAIVRAAAEIAKQISEE